jgi:hypothetical protein
MCGPEIGSKSGASARNLRCRRRRQWARARQRRGTRWRRWQSSTRLPQGLTLVHFSAQPEPFQGLTLVHFSAQPEPVLSLKYTDTTQRVPQRLLASNKNVDEFTVVHFSAQPQAFLSLKYTETTQRLCLTECSRQAKQRTSVSP